MPNTLAHIAINIPATQIGFKQLDPKWVLLGTVLPDIPWILQRFITNASISINLYDLRTYLIIQSTLIFTIVLAISLALFSSNFLRTLSILVFGSVIHLLSDALEIKWANGIHLFAPVDWTLLNFGLFWPDSIPVYVISFIGIIVFVMLIRKNNQGIKFRSPGKRMYFITLLLLCYFVLPFLFFSSVRNADNHFIDTLSEFPRAGKYVEIDRGYFVNHPNGDYLESFADEKIMINNVDLQRSGLISIKGKFINDKEIYITDYFLHHTGVRSFLAVFGLALVFFYWCFVFIKGIRERKREVRIPADTFS